MSGPELTRGERRKQQTSERLLDAALRLFLSRGYESVSTADIAAAADVGAGTFYLHFKDKRDIFVAIGKRTADEVISKWSGAMRPGMSAAEMVTGMLRLGAEVWQQSPERARLLLEAGPPIEAQGYVGLTEDVAKALEQAGCKTTVPLAVLANLIVALTFQLGRLVLAGKGEDVSSVVDGASRLISKALS